MFKKKKIKKQKKTKNIFNYILYFIFFIIFVLVTYILGKNYNFDIYNNISKIENKKLTKEEKAKIETERKEKEIKLKIKKEEEQRKKLDWKKENILIIGRWGYWNDAPYLTDSLILLSYYKEKKQISMLSIPRDLYVDYNDTNKFWKEIKAKINWLYVHYLAKYNDEKKAVEKLEEKIEEITWEKIDYYVNIDFKWFIKLINSIWWIVVNVKKNLYDPKYPDNNHWFQVFSLSKWKQKLYWETALKYARSRHNSGWDFGRSERQQQILKAIKNKVLSSEYLTSPSKIKNLYNIFDKYITTDIWFIEFVKLATNIKLEKNLSFYSSTINTSCMKNDECKKWWFLYYPQRRFFWWQSVLLPEWADKDNLSNFKKIKKYSDIVFNYPNLFKENYKISIFAKNKDKQDAIKLRQELKKYWLKINVLERIWNIPETPIIPFHKGDENKKNKITLEEYNKLKKQNIDIQKYLSKKDQKIKYSNWIEKEANNKSTKIIINGVDINSNTIKFLKKYLNLEKKDILVNIDWPKYAIDKNTNIEIIYKK